MIDFAYLHLMPLSIQEAAEECDLVLFSLMILKFPNI